MNMATLKAASKRESFAGYLFRDKKDNWTAVVLIAVFAAIYVILNYPYVSYMKANVDMLMPRSPFYGAPFTLNLFNFDPSMYYGYPNMTVIHPFMNLAGGSLSYAALKTGAGNLLFLGIQSLINGLSVALLYLILRRAEGERSPFPLALAAWFGASSYTMFSALIPDSYPYAQCLIIASVLYLTYLRSAGERGAAGPALAALLNFGVTSTNLLTFAGAYVFSTMNRRLSENIRIWAKVAALFVVFAAALTGLQLLLFDGKSWINNWQQGLSNGGFSYVAPFSFEHHWKAVYMMFVSPVLSPDVALIDSGLVAIATDLAKPYPVYVSAIGLLLLALAAAGWIRGFKQRETWTYAVYILFAVALHLVVGYGLAAFKYDLYLYAGHYLFALFALASIALRSVKSARMRKAAVAVIAAMAAATLVHNVWMHGETLSRIDSAYEQMALQDAAAERPGF